MQEKTKRWTKKGLAESVSTDVRKPNDVWSCLKGGAGVKIKKAVRPVIGRVSCVSHECNDREQIS